jgi:polyhydroxybutyrate depolymerase
VEEVGMAFGTAAPATRSGSLAVAAAVLALAAACSSPAPTTTPGRATPSRTPVTGTSVVALHGRQFTLHIPGSYDPAKPAPLLLLLHGYTASGATQESYLQFTPESDRQGFIYAYPDGKIDQRNQHYWNATDACCDLFHTNVDDSGYLSDVIRNIEATYRVDTRRVYLVGHSNGAFMAFRMACDHADQITAIAPLNGAMWADIARCRPSTAVSVLDIRSTADETINYAGGTILNVAYPSAARTDADWLALDRCTGSPVKAASLDLVTNLAGAETSVQRHPACASGSTVETWTINGGVHIPAFSHAFAAEVTGFLLARSKP